MDSQDRFLFVSYAREDIDRVQPLVDVVRNELKFRGVPVKIWMDTADLKPGERWNLVISQALEASIGLLFFVSPGSLQSEWTRRELEIAAKSSDRLIIPVLLHAQLNLPISLQTRQWLDISNIKTQDEIFFAGKKIADAAVNYLNAIPSPRAPVPKAEGQKLADLFAAEVRTANEPPSEGGPQNAVFLVHGHCMEALAEIENHLETLGITPVVLSRQDESAQSLFQKFMSVAQKARFAVVLLSSDDYGASRRQYETEGVADRALQFRTRQNVILELGFFYGRLGWENVYVVYRDPDKVFPNFERPSDLDGVVFDSMSTNKWKKNLEEKLEEAGFVLLTRA